MKKIIDKLFQPLGIEVKKKFTSQIEHGSFQELDTIFRFFLERNGGGTSHAQLSQDIFALVANGMKRGGYFVEFGATNGIDLSNTRLLEQSYGWTGILAEPDPRWHAALKKNRSCTIDDRCVWKTTGETLEFAMAQDGEFSTISEFREGGTHSNRTLNAEQTAVETISLIDLLKYHSAPKEIDFLSIDTEGSEYEILSSFDLREYKFHAIAVEHNFSSDRNRIFELLTNAGYRRVFNYVSRWDDWYVRAE